MRSNDENQDASKAMKMALCDTRACKSVSISVYARVFAKCSYEKGKNADEFGNAPFCCVRHVYAHA